MDSDFFLIRRMKGGDEQAIELFVRKYYDDILNYCYRHMGRREDAQDVAQETFERFFRGFSQYEHHGKAKNYLYVIAGNLCKNYYRARERTPEGRLDARELSQDGSSEPKDPGKSPMDTVETRMDVVRALEALPEEFREVAILYYYQELKQKEISEILNIGLPLVKYRAARAKELLRQMLEEEDHGKRKEI